MDQNRDILRIYICGPHSTGKTTLLHDLLPHLTDVTVVEEVARDIIKKHGWTRDDFLPDTHPDVFYQLNAEIVGKQIELDGIYTGEGHDYICDRALDPLIYASFYVKGDSRQNMLNIPGIQDWLERMWRSLVFLVAPHPECISDDSVRLTSSMEELWEFYYSFERELNEQKIPYCAVMELDRDRRVKQVLEALAARK